MNARERYLAVFDDDKRKNLDHVPRFVQYLRPEFIRLHKENFLVNKLPFQSSIPGFMEANFVGFESIFGDVPPGLRVSRVKVEDENGKKVAVSWNGQPISKQFGYYKRGLFFSKENFNKVRETLRVVDDSIGIRKILDHFDEISPYIFPVIGAGGIFDTLWQSMGFNYFSMHHRKNSKLYQELVKYFAELTRIKVQAIIDATGNRAGIINILDDIAFKGRPMISPERWDKDFGRYYKEICSMISDAGMKVQMHSDGDVTDMVPILEKLGFNGLQGWEGGADPIIINEKYPDFVVIGFGDISNILPFGSKLEIYNHVKELMDVLKENRHFIIGPSTVIYEGIPYENVMHFIEASRRYGKY
ncbi:MAG: uroporphyrinogen decarboxylase family protein [Promethearchaeota archaeon]